MPKPKPPALKPVPLTPVVSLGKHTGSGRHFGVKEVLQEALAQVESGVAQANKCVVVYLEHVPAEKRYSVSWSQCGMDMSELVALLEIAKHDVIAVQMHGAPPEEE